MKCHNDSRNKEIIFSDKEKQFLHNNWVHKIATVSSEKIPHAVPVVYVFAEYSYTTALT